MKRRGRPSAHAKIVSDERKPFKADHLLSRAFTNCEGLYDEQHAGGAECMATLAAVMDAVRPEVTSLVLR
jgi:hypothetical protein